MKCQTLLPLLAFAKQGNAELIFLRRALGGDRRSFSELFDKALRKANFFGQDKLSGYYVMSSRHVVHRIAPLLDLLITFALAQIPPFNAEVANDSKTVASSSSDLKDKGDGDSDSDDSLVRAAEDEAFLFSEPRVLLKALRREVSIEAVVRLCEYECNSAKHGSGLAQNRVLVWLALLKDGYADCVGADSVIPFTRVLVALTDLLRTSEMLDWLWEVLGPWIVRVVTILQRSKSAAEKFFHILEAAARQNDSTLKELLKIRKELGDLLKSLELKFLDGM
jgi:hypothetical protein